MTAKIELELIEIKNEFLQAIENAKTWSVDKSPNCWLEFTIEFVDRRAAENWMMENFGDCGYDDVPISVDGGEIEYFSIVDGELIRD